ncbi:MAG: hypothetical protein MZV64_28460 [Ignavibacteriales bacterium]|nr:hypothetical protein [Ignavibacteriales bacterium]
MRSLSRPPLHAAVLPRMPERCHHSRPDSPEVSRVVQCRQTGLRPGGHRARLRNRPRTPSSSTRSSRKEILRRPSRVSPRRFTSCTWGSGRSSRRRWPRASRAWSRTVCRRGRPTRSMSDRSNRTRTFRSF